MKKDFPLVDELNNFIKYSDQGGLILKWLKDYEWSQQKFEIDYHVDYESLSLEYIWGGLIIYCCQCLLAFTTVIAEQMIHKNARKPNAAKLWIYAEMFIDADRHFLLNKYDFLK